MSECTNYCLPLMCLITCCFILHDSCLYPFQPQPLLLSLSHEGEPRLINRFAGRWCQGKSRRRRGRRGGQEREERGRQGRGTRGSWVSVWCMNLPLLSTQPLYWQTCVECVWGRGGRCKRGRRMEEREEIAAERERGRGNRQTTTESKKKRVLIMYAWTCVYVCDIDRWK